MDERHLLLLRAAAEIFSAVVVAWLFTEVYKIFPWLAGGLLVILLAAVLMRRR